LDYGQGRSRELEKKTEGDERTEPSPEDGDGF
jgi:hypothetical protein